MMSLTVARSKETAEELGFIYPVLSDPGNRLGRQLALLFRLRDDLRAIYRRDGYDLKVINNDDSWELPAAATFIVDQEGKIRLAFVDPTYMTRAEPDDLVAVLKDLRQE